MVHMQAVCVFFYSKNSKAIEPIHELVGNSKIQNLFALTYPRSGNGSFDIFPARLFSAKQLLLTPQVIVWYGMVLLLLLVFHNHMFTTLRQDCFHIRKKVGGHGGMTKIDRGGWDAATTCQTASSTYFFPNSFLFVRKIYQTPPFRHCFSCCTYFCVLNIFACRINLVFMQRKFVTFVRVCKSDILV